MTPAPVTVPFDPRTLGCKCDACPLKDRTPVAPEIRPGKPLVIGEMPGGEETKTGSPFVGRSGRELIWTLILHGKKREDMSYDNAGLCQPPGTNLKRYTARLSRLNKRRKKEGLEKLPHPLKCCWPHLERSIATASALLPVGGTALTVLRDHCKIFLKPDLEEKRGRGEKGMMRLRGFPVWTKVGDGAGGSRMIPTVATIHPAFVLRKRRWTHTFRHDIGKLWRHAEGRLQWWPPEIIFDPTPEELANALGRLAGTVVGVDVETEGKEAMTSPLRCVGLGNETLAVVAGFKSVEERGRRWKCPPETARRLIAAFFTRVVREGTLLTGNIVNVFDRIKLAVEGMPLPPYNKVFDNTISHHVTDPEIPHSLDFQSSRYTDAPKHKDVKDHLTGWKDDLELHTYNALDCTQSATLTPIFARKLHDTDLVPVYRSDVRLQRLCVGMHVVGMQVDSVERARHYARLETAKDAAALRAVQAAGREINLESPQQIQRLLFDHWGQAPTSVETDGGEPSTNKAAIYELELRSLPEEIRAFLDALMGFRRAKKLFEYVRDLPNGGRVHSHFAAHVTPVGRITSSDPNVLNVSGTKIDPDSIRSIFVPRPGCVFVYADMAQFHLRIVAVLAKIRIWLETFARGDDLHRINAAIFFNKLAAAIEKYERDFEKTLIYQLIYKGGVRNAWQVMQQVRKAATGERPYAGIKLRKIRALRERLLRTIPELEVWWEATLQERREKGELRDAVLGRRHTLLDSVDGDEEASQIINAPVLMAEGGIMGGDGVSGRVMDAVGFEFESDGPRGMGGPGVINQNYDSMLLEVAEDRADEAEEILEREMTTTFEVDGWSCVIPAEPSRGIRWSKVG